MYGQLKNVFSCFKNQADQYGSNRTVLEDTRVPQVCE